MSLWCFQPFWLNNFVVMSKFYIEVPIGKHTSKWFAWVPFHFDLHEVHKWLRINSSSMPDSAGQDYVTATKSCTAAFTGLVDMTATKPKLYRGGAFVYMEQPCMIHQCL